MRELMWLKRVLGKFPSGGKHQKLTHLFRELLSEVYLIKISVRLLPHSDWNILNFRIRVLPCINKWFSVGIYLARTQLTNWPYPYRTYFPQVIMSFYFTSMSLKLATIVGNANVPKSLSRLLRPFSVLYSDFHLPKYLVSNLGLNSHGSLMERSTWNSQISGIHEERWWINKEPFLYLNM